MPVHDGHEMVNVPEPLAAPLRAAMSKLLSEQVGHPVFTLEAEVWACRACHVVRLSYPNGDAAEQVVNDSPVWGNW